MHGKHHYGTSFKADFTLNDVVHVWYLDVVVEGPTKASVRYLGIVQDKILASGITNKYIEIISYDAVSEYYCNKIFPKIKRVERNLRNCCLMFISPTLVLIILIRLLTVIYRVM